MKPLQFLDQDLPSKDRRLLLAFGFSVAFHLGLLYTGPVNLSEKSPSNIPSSPLSVRLFNGRRGEEPSQSLEDKPQHVATEDASQLNINGRKASATDATSAEGATTGRAAAIPNRALPAPYLSPLELTKRPEFVVPIPAYLPYSIGAAEHTRIVFVIFVDENGVIDKIEHDAPGTAGAVTRFVERLIRSTPITPGEKDGRPVRTRWLVEFEAAPIIREQPSPSPSPPLDQSAASSPEAK